MIGCQEICNYKRKADQASGKGAKGICWNVCNKQTAELAAAVDSSLYMASDNNYHLQVHGSDHSALGIPIATQSGLKKPVEETSPVQEVIYAIR